MDHRLRATQAYVRHDGLDRVVGAGPRGPPRRRLHRRPTSTSWAPSPASAWTDDLAGSGVRVLKLAMTYPLVPETVVEFASSVDEVVVIEEKRPFVETQLRSILHEAGSTLREGDRIVPVRGEQTGRGRRWCRRWASWGRRPWRPCSQASSPGSWRRPRP